MEAEAYQNVDHSEVVKFIEETIIYRFSMFESIMVDMETIFTSQHVKEFAQDYGIQLLYSTPYYTQAKRQAEASNKIIKDLIRKTIKENSRSWHELLPQVLSTYNTSCKASINISSYTLTYGHNAVFLMEIVVPSLRTVF